MFFFVCISVFLFIFCAASCVIDDDDDDDDDVTLGRRIISHTMLSNAAAKTGSKLLSLGVRQPGRGERDAWRVCNYR